MITLSLYEPWATLVVIGAKCFETRSWPTAYRGRLLIHAANHFTKVEREICMEEPFASVLRKAGFENFSDLPLGKIIGSVEVTGCFATVLVRNGLSDQERAFGNYADGRFAHRYVNPVRFAQPQDYRGAQRYFHCKLPAEMLG